MKEWMKEMLRGFLYFIGYSLIGFGVLLVFVSHLQSVTFEVLLPWYECIALGGIILILMDWVLNKNRQKKLSVLALCSFTIGFICFVLLSGGVNVTGPIWMWTFVILLFSFVSIFISVKLIREKVKGINMLVGHSLAITGASLSIINLLITSIVLFAKSSTTAW